MAGASPLAIWDDHRVKVEQIAVQGVTALERAVLDNPTMSRTELAWIIRHVNTEWGTLAAQDAADTMVMARATAGQYDLEAPTVIDPITMEVAEAIAGWAQAGETPEAVLRRAAISTTRHLRNSSRDTVELSTALAGTGWCRVPRPGCCAFCLMLASRGAVYTSRDAALTVGGGRRKRGKRPPGSRYHDNCGCMVQEVLPKHGVPPIVAGMERILADLKRQSPTKMVTLDDWSAYETRQRRADAAARRSEAATMTSARAKGRAVKRRPGETDADYWERRAQVNGIDFHGEPAKGHEVVSMEAVMDLGEDVEWIPRAKSAPRNDMWLNIGSERVQVELKSAPADYDKIRSRILKASSSAARHPTDPLTKDAFIVDIGDASLSDGLSEQLAGYNRGRQKYRLKHLLVLSNNGTRMTAIPLQPA
ncbi:MAG: hypothetical protein Q4C85_08590 [Actinomyces sp.]|uniref:VG15 protein n=1 Tax=Actinomyces sp. TaxID=29317 RepID=UPI0026DAC8BA|nr:hypothetical protein [Actinomyces sp.]MDO4243795.1 hypothetical protein [Actinomyces sp.]